MPRAQPERALHNAVAAYLRVALPEEAVWTTFPAGGGGRVRGAQLRAAGLMAGWPDVQILWRQGFVAEAARLHVLALELKAPKGRLSVDQVRCHCLLAMVGARVYVCRSVEEVEAALRDAGVPLKATLGRAA